MTQTLLVRTPAQHPQESPGGYLLRLAEANGYETPAELSAVLDSGRDSLFSAKFDIARLAPFLGVNARKLVGYRPPGKENVYSLQLLGHTVATNALTQGCSRICPECVAERGFVPAWLDLAVMDGCPIHRKEQLTACQACNEPLSWRRPGLLQCSCGASLAQQRGCALEPAHAALLASIVAKLENRPLQAGSGFPLEVLTGLSAAALLALVRNLATLDQAPGDTRSAAATAAQMLQDWPHNIDKAVRRWVGANPSRAGDTKPRWTVGLMRRTLLRHVSSVDDVALLRAATRELFTDIVADVPRKPKRRRPPHHKGQDSHGQEPAVQVPGGCANSEFVTTREAAALLSLPVSVFEHLRRTGYFTVKHRVRGIGRTRRADVLQFADRLLALANAGQPGKASSEQGLNVVTLAKTLRRTFLYIAGKGELLAAMLDGEMPVVGQHGEGVGGLLLPADTADAFVRHGKISVLNGGLTATEVAEALGCDPTMVANMVAKGHLSGWSAPTGLRVAPDSVEEFHRHYRAVAILARELGSSAQAFGRLIKERGFASMEFKRTSSGSQVQLAPQRFVPVEEVPALMGAMRARMEENRKRRIRGGKRIRPTPETLRPCPSCGSRNAGHSGSIPGGKRRFVCRDCRRNFVETPHPHRLTNDERAKVHALFAGGMRMAAIARELGKGYKAVRLAVAQYKAGQARPQPPAAES